MRYFYFMILFSILVAGTLGFLRVNQSIEMSKWESFTLHEREAEMMYYQNWKKYHNTKGERRWTTNR